MSEQVRKDIISVQKKGMLTDVLLLTCSFLHTKEEILLLFKEKRVLVNETVVTKDVLVTPSDSLLLLTPQSAEPIVDTHYTVLYEDDFLLAVNKPSPLPIHPAGKYYFNTLVSLLKRAGKRVYPINRLDKETSGIVLFATSPFHTRALQLAMRDDSCVKTYFAVTFGIPSPAQGLIDAPLAQSLVDSIRDKTVVQRDGKKSLTRYKVIESQQNFALLQVTPLSGRRHQIRAHLFYLGYPIVGDKQYGLHPELFLRWQENSVAIEDEVKEKLLALRQLLHCAQLSFKHPLTGKQILLSAPLPEVMLQFLHSHGFSSF